VTRRRSPRATRKRAAPTGIEAFTRGPLLRPVVTLLVLGLPAVLLPGVAVVSRAGALEATAATAAPVALVATAAPVALVATAAPVVDLAGDAAGRGPSAPPTGSTPRGAPAPASLATPGPASGGGLRPAERATPVRLVLPALGVDAPVVPVGLEADGQMEVPSDVATVGWYEPVAGAGVVPGGTGTAVLAGHVSSFTRGPGAFASLARLVAGDEVIVGLTDGHVQRWSVVSVERHPKDRLPLDELFTWGGPPRLVLVTCGGTFDLLAGSHRDNLVIRAVPIGIDAATPEVIVR